MASCCTQRRRSIRLLFVWIGAHAAGLFAVALLLFAPTTHAQQDMPTPVAGLATDARWLALLHSDGTRSGLTGSGLLLIEPFQGGHAELVATWQLLYAGDDASNSESRCRYPARYLLIEEAIHGPTPIDPLAHCASLIDFIERAPMDRLQLAFAGENLLSASSMMGHTMLVLEGRNRDGVVASHAVSFFTVIDSINLPRVIFESLITGKPGYFTLTPYAEKRDHYVNVEARNLWRLTLAASGAARRRLQAHLHELRTAKLRYDFDSFNCATLTANLLRVAFPDTRFDGAMWTTPLDIMQAAAMAGLIESIDADLAPAWEYRMLRRQRADLDRTAKATASQRRHLELQLDASVADYQASTGQLDAAHWAARMAAIQAQQPPSTEPPIPVDARLAPYNAPQDSQWRGGAGYDGQQSLISVGFLAAGHRLIDSSSHTFGEYDLRIGDIDIDCALRDGHCRLQQLTIYSVASLLPYDRVVGGSSWNLALGAETQVDDDGARRTVPSLSGGLGHSLMLSRSVQLFAQGRGGVGYHLGRAFLYGGPVVGGVLSVGNSAKLIATWQRDANPLGQHQQVDQIRIQSLYRLNRLTGIVLEGRILPGRGHDASRSVLSVVRYF